MLQIDTGILAAVITILVSIIGLSAWVGALSQRVKANENGREQNRADHQLIYTKLEEINKYLRDGRAK